MHDNHDERDDEDQVDKAPGDVHGQAENPAKDEDDTYNGEHGIVGVVDVPP